MPTTKQRREAARRHLERQLQRREEREAARKRFTLIASIAGTIVLIALISVFVLAVTKEDKGTNKAGSKASGSPTPSTSQTPSASPTPSAAPSTKARAAKGPTARFEGVSVVGAADLGGAPGVTAKSSTVAKKLAYKDLVIGKGASATPASSVTVQYVGALYKDGKVFDSSWARGSAATFALSGVVPGFTQGIGGTKGVPPMKVGGRRIMILPAALGYGAQGSGSTIPPNASLVFVVDLKTIGAA